MPQAAPLIGVPSPYGAWSQRPATTERNPLGMWSLILGLSPVVLITLLVAALSSGTADGLVVLLAFAWFGGTIVAIVLGSMSIKAGSRGEATNKGMGIAGMVLGIISLVFLLLGFLVAGIAALF